MGRPKGSKNKKTLEREKLKKEEYKKLEKNTEQNLEKAKEIVTITQQVSNEKKQKHGRRTKKQIRLENQAVDIKYYSQEIMPGYVWVFLRAMAAKRNDLFEHEYDYLLEVRNFAQKAIKINGNRNFCDLLMLSLDTLIKSMEDGSAPHLDLSPYIRPKEPKLKGFIKKQKK